MKNTDSPSSFRYRLTNSSLSVIQPRRLLDTTMTVVGSEYCYSKFVRGDNSPKYAKYLGYLDASDLYPDSAPRSFEAFAKEVLDGKAAKIYEGFSLRA